MVGTTNLQLINLAKDLSIPNFHCICIDERNVRIIDHMNQCPTNNTPINIIVNLNDSDNNVNGHKCLCFINDDQNVYYSSFGGDPIPNQVKEFMIKVDDLKILSSNFQIQLLITDTCGLYCILIFFVKL